MSVGEGVLDSDTKMPAPSGADAKQLCRAIHMACGHGGAPPRLVEKLLRVHPRGVFQRLRGCDYPTAAQAGMELLPLHRALLAVASPDLVALLLENDGGGWSVEGIKEWSTETVKEKCEGLLPLHIGASMPGTALATLERLVSKHPKALQEKEGQSGLLPLHLSIWNHMPAAIVEFFLVKTAPTHRSRTKGSRSPLHVAAATCAPPELLALLLQEEQEVGVSAFYFSL